MRKQVRTESAATDRIQTMSAVSVRWSVTLARLRHTTAPPRAVSPQPRVGPSAPSDWQRSATAGVQTRVERVTERSVCWAVVGESSEPGGTHM